MLTTAHHNYRIVKGLRAYKQREHLQNMWCLKYTLAPIIMYQLQHGLIHIHIYIYIYKFIHLYVLEAIRAQFHMGFNLCGLKYIYIYIYIYGLKSIWVELSMVSNLCDIKSLWAQLCKYHTCTSVGVSFSNLSFHEQVCGCFCFCVRDRRFTSVDTVSVS